MGVAEIKRAIADLSPEQYCELMAELRPPLADDEWDLRMREDAVEGKLNFVDQNIQRAHAQATLTPIERIVEE